MLRIPFHKLGREAPIPTSNKTISGGLGFRCGFRVPNVHEKSLGQGPRGELVREKDGELSGIDSGYLVV